MTIYTFKPSDLTQLANWDDPSFWVGGVVPNNVDADVVFPVVTYVATGQPYITDVVVQADETFAVHSVVLHDNLTIEGALSTTGDFTQDDPVNSSGSLTIGGHYEQDGGLYTTGSLSAGSITSDQSMQGAGQITTGAFTNNSYLQATGGDLSVHATSLSNAGSIEAYDNLSLDVTSFSNTGAITAYGGALTLNIGTGVFSNLSDGTLTGGTYTANAPLTLNGVGPISVDAATISISNGGMLTTHDPATGQDVALTSSLTTIAPTGTLSIDGDHTFGALTDAGQLNVTGTFSSSQLTIAETGTFNASGTINAPIANQGTIFVNTAVFNGPVTGPGHIQVGNTLELNAPTAENVSFYNAFGTLQLDQPTSYTGTIAPTGLGDRILIPGISASSITSTNYSGTSTGGKLTLQESNGATLSFNFAGDYTTASFIITPAQLLSSDPPILSIGVGPRYVYVCFVTGTKILCPGGERAVETLRVGDAVETWSGTTKAISWIGSSTIIVNPDARQTSPVIVRAGALADNVPHRDLHVTAGHSLLLDGMLIPVSSLVNGRSILVDDAARIITVYHVELAEHDILVADGAPAESYRDDGNQPLFTRTAGASVTGASPPVAPIRTEGPAVDAIWRRLVDRIGGPVAGLVDDPDLHLVVDGDRIDVAAMDDNRYVFRLGRQPRDVVLASRAAVPAHIGTIRDNRRLGVAVRAIVATGAELTIETRYDGDPFVSGAHEAERTEKLRWTDGAGQLSTSAWLPVETQELIVEIACFAQYLPDCDTSGVPLEANSPLHDFLQSGIEAEGVAA